MTNAINLLRLTFNVHFFFLPRLADLEGDLPPPPFLLAEGDLFSMLSIRPRRSGCSGVAGMAPFRRKCVIIASVLLFGLGDLESVPPS